MKYLLDFLSSGPDASPVQDVAFQQLLVDVHAGRSQARSNDQFYDSLEKIVNELRSSPEAVIFLKPVSKKDAPDYSDYVKKPMDLSTVLRNVKATKYKNKAAFQSDLDLIWENCLLYNAFEDHPLRATAKYMKQKSDYLLEYLQDRVDRGPALLFPGLIGSPSPSIPVRPGTGGASRGTTSAIAVDVQDEDEDAAGEDEDGDVDMGEGDNLLRLAREGSRAGNSRAGSAAPRAASDQPVPFRDDRPNLTPNLDNYPALVRSAHSTSHYLDQPNPAGPSYSDKGKGRDTSSMAPAPAWYPSGSSDPEAKANASWWAALSKDEAYVGGIPTTLRVAAPIYRPRKRIPHRSQRMLSMASDGHLSADKKPDGETSPGQKRRVVRLEAVIHRSVDELNTARRIANSIHDWQRIEADGGILPPVERFENEKEKRKQAELARRRDAREEKKQAHKRRKLGREVGETEAASGCKRAAAGILAHAGFDGANEGALDLFTRVATEHIRNLGRTFRLLVDGFSRQMSSEEIMLHALFENGHIRPHDLETHIKDEIEREGAKIAEMTRRVKQAYTEVTTAPVIEDDMMFAENGEMLTDGNFADELGEDFLGLRDLGVAGEHGLSSLTVPPSLFYGRKKRAADAAAAGKSDALDYAVPPPLVPLNPATYHTQLPALLHAFFAARIESGLGLEDDPAFETAHAAIGSLGQVTLKPPPAPSAVKKKVTVNGSGAGEGGAPGSGTGSGEKKKVVKKPSIPGIGKGNWVRPGKEDKAKKAADKGGGSSAETAGPEIGAVNGATVNEEEDAEGEVEE